MRRCNATTRRPDDNRNCEVDGFLHQKYDPWTRRALQLFIYNMERIRTHKKRYQKCTHVSHKRRYIRTHVVAFLNPTGQGFGGHLYFPGKHCSQTSSQTEKTRKDSYDSLSPRSCMADIALAFRTVLCETILKYT